MKIPVLTPWTSQGKWYTSLISFLLHTSLPVEKVRLISISCYVDRLILTERSWLNRNESMEPPNCRNMCRIVIGSLSAVVLQREDEPIASIYRRAPNSKRGMKKLIMYIPSYLPVEWNNRNPEPARLIGSNLEHGTQKLRCH